MHESLRDEIGRASGVRARVLTYGPSAEADLRVTPVPPRAFVAKGREFKLKVPGFHNALNAAAVLLLTGEVGIPLEVAARALERFEGVGRRLEVVGAPRGVSVIDDYAHHPTEVAAALRAARNVVGDGRIIAIHQPHLYSRTRLMAGDFAKVYEELADHTVVLDVYGAREDPEPGVTGALVSDRFARPEHVAFIADWPDAADHTARIARPGDFVITLGCGDVYRIVPQILGSLERERRG